jgi:hypothetical protein
VFEVELNPLAEMFKAEAPPPLAELPKIPKDFDVDVPAVCLSVKVREPAVETRFSFPKLGTLSAKATSFQVTAIITYFPAFLVVFATVQTL